MLRKPGLTGVLTWVLFRPPNRMVLTARDGPMWTYSTMGLIPIWIWYTNVRNVRTQCTRLAECGRSSYGVLSPKKLQTLRKSLASTGPPGVRCLDPLRFRSALD